jgi:hypothetical protein
MNSTASLTDDDLERLENAIALTITLGETLKRAIYHTRETDTLEYLADIVKIAVQLRSLLISWRTGQQEDYNQMTQPELIDRLDNLLALADSLWREISEIKSAIVSKKF